MPQSILPGQSSLPMQSSLPIDATILQLMTNRNAQLQKNTDSQAAQVQQINTQIKYANDLINKLHTSGYAPTTAELSFLHQNNIPYSPSSVQITIAGLQSLINRLTANAQLSMIQLQSLMSKQNQAAEMLSNVMSKYNDLQNSIVGNMR